MIEILALALLLVAPALDASASDALDEALYGHLHDASAEAAVDVASLALPALVPEEPPCGTTIHGELVLDRDLSCSVALASGAVLDLNGFTLEGVVFGLGAEGATVRNGTVLRGALFPQGDCWRCTIEDVAVLDGDGFVVQPGAEGLIRGCYFSGNEVAVDLFFSGSTRIEGSSFADNDIGVLLSRTNANVIAANELRGNRVGVRLWDEVGSSVSHNEIDGNDFEGNDVGLLIAATKCGEGHPQGCLNGNQVAGNRFAQNRGSGIFVDASGCSELFGTCAAIDASIRDNLFSSGGFAPPLSGGILLDDGLTVAGPVQAVDGLTLAENVAVANADLGIEAPGVTDGGGNLASGNGNPLQCVGVACAPAGPALVQELLAFFDEQVASGALSGAGPGRSGPHRLRALRNGLAAAEDLLAQDRTAEACFVLEAARRRTDGGQPPPDFASGPAAPALAAEIAELEALLRCDEQPAFAFCGLGAELAWLLPPLALWRRRRGAGRA